MTPCCTGSSSMSRRCTATTADPKRRFRIRSRLVCAGSESKGRNSDCSITLIGRSPSTASCPKRRLGGTPKRGSVLFVTVRTSDNWLEGSALLQGSQRASGGALIHPCAQRCQPRVQLCRGHCSCWLSFRGIVGRLRGMWFRRHCRSRERSRAPWTPARCIPIPKPLVDRPSNARRASRHALGQGVECPR